MHKNKLSEILFEEAIKTHKPETDFPFLFEQMNEFRQGSVLQNLEVLHTTPLFRNTLPKLAAIAAGGAKLIVVPPAGLPFDSEVFHWLQEMGVAFPDLSQVKSVDLVIDCMGFASNIPSRYGSVELTKSGESRYESKSGSAISVDRSKIKCVEDLLGTADGLLRAMDRLKISPRSKLVLFGFGKVGKGVYFKLKSLGAEIELVEKDLSQCAPLGIAGIDFSNRAEVSEAIQRAELIITATGAIASLEGFDKQIFKGKTLINIGAEDEYGPSFSSTEVLNQKRPLNFILDEPTRLRYLDPTFALQAYSARDLLTGGFQPGLQKPLVETEKRIMNQIRNSPLWDEISSLSLQPYF